MALDHYVTLGRSGLRVSPLCLGAMTFGEDLGWGSSVEESQQIMDRYIAACGNSLRRLQTDYIDLYWLHNWDVNTPIDETMATLEDLVRAGKVRYIGVSDTPAWKVVEANMLARFRGWSAFIGLQIEYSLLER